MRRAVICICRIAFAATVAASGVFISGCGGGGGSGPLPPPAPGTLDTSFGQGGTVTTLMGNELAAAAAVALQVDGKIIAAGDVGGGTAFAFARYNADGSLDQGFGANGVVIIAGLPQANANALALQPDGKIVTAGASRNGSQPSSCALTRMTSVGALDPSFGTGGIVTTQLAHVDPAIAYTSCGGVGLQPNGKIVAAAAGSGEPSGTLGVVRFNADGSRDDSFGTGGEAVAQTTFPGVSAEVVFVQPDGKIIVGGESTLTTLVGVAGEVIVARFDASGMLDPTFGQGGVFRTPVIAYYVGPSSFALQPDGKIVVSYLGQMQRLLADGTIDMSFGVSGTVSGVRLSQIALQTNGKIVGVGTGGNFFVWRFGADGSADTTFGLGGIVSNKVGVPGFAYSSAVVVQPDGHIVAAGSTAVINPTGVSPPGIYVFALARYIGD